MGKWGGGTPHQQSEGISETGGKRALIVEQESTNCASGGCESQPWVEMNKHGLYTGKYIHDPQ